MQMSHEVMLLHIQIKYISFYYYPETIFQIWYSFWLIFGHPKVEFDPMSLILKLRPVMTKKKLHAKNQILRLGVQEV